MSTTLQQRQAAVVAAEQELLAAREQHRITQSAVKPAVNALFDLRAKLPEPAREIAMLDLIGGNATDMFNSALSGRGLSVSGDAGATARAIGALLANLGSPYAEPWQVCLAAFSQAAATKLEVDGAIQRLCASLLAG